MIFLNLLRRFSLTFQQSHSSFLSITLSQAHPTGFNFGWGGHHGGMSFGLSPQFYQFSCPQANDIVISVWRRPLLRISELQLLIVDFTSTIASFR
ncbi:peroxidase 9-like [Trifolium medium]|uniref:Peroxidase 9-like n=1 Tax=Trifolium medium TaxID=97028 RepID=A0A392MSS6_9FABA|nr:peroxidase 9-like [Trifolium medium]